MWTGDMQSGYPTQWALNPSAYQNVSNEEVDWASLAQQWIKMKETYPAEQVPPAPPPPPIKPEDNNDIEGGEAPMDMSKDEAEPQPPPSNSVTQDGGSWGNWNNWQQWGWGWGGSGPVNAAPILPATTAAAAAAAATAAGTTTAATAVTTPNKAVIPAASTAAATNTAVPPYNYTAPPSVPHNFAGDTNSAFEYNHGGSVPEHFNQQGYWTGGPAPFIRGNKGVSGDWRDARGGHGRHAVKPEEDEVDTTTVIDAAKRKQLPAWIREGLEKMEREKQKKLDKERQMREREEELSKKRQEEEDALHNFDAGVIVKSKFDTDSEESDKEEVAQVKERKSRFHDGPILQNVKPTVSLPSPPPPVQRKSKEQIMQEVMVKVRHVLTEILMSVTNEEMRVILEEELVNARAKAPAMHLRNTPALTSLTGKLGLGIYDTESEASSGESDGEESDRENTIDSDQELRERVQRRKQEFTRVAHEIENRILEQEERERRLMIEDEQENEEEIGHETEAQVDTSHNNAGVKVEAEIVEEVSKSDVKLNASYSEREQLDHYASDSVHKESSYEQSDESDDDDDSSDDSSYSSSRSSSDSHYRKSHKSTKRHKDKKSRSKSKRKRSRSRGSDRRKSSHRKSSRESRRDDRRRRSRSRSRDRRSRSRERYYSDNHRYRRSSSRHRHSSELYSSARKRHRYSRSSSSDAPRGKKSSHRSRD